LASSNVEEKRRWPGGRGWAAKSGDGKRSRMRKREKRMRGV
jgi:hypothetical protein